MFKRLIIGLVLVVFYCTPANAFFYPGSRLVEHMREYEKYQHGENFDKFGATIYMGYVAGVFDSHSHSIKTSPEITLEQVLAITAKYLKAHPDGWNDSASDLILKALMEAFPKQ